MIILNPNSQYSDDTGMLIPQNATPSDHANFVWKNYVINSGFESILLLAHSAGGECVKAIQTNF